MTTPPPTDDSPRRLAAQLTDSSADSAFAADGSWGESADVTPPPPSPEAEAARRQRSAANFADDTLAAANTPAGERGQRTLPRIPGYEIMGVLGDGGMGVVYQARQLKPERIVALKMIRAGELANSAVVQRFQVEISAVAKLHHTNIVQLYEIGDAAGLPYFTMEYIEGGSLNEQMPKRPRAPREAAELVELLARAVHYAHERGIVHRDLKPGNVLLTPLGEPKISDFGLAKLLSGSSDAPMTQTGAPLGTPEYMSPEQALGAKHIGPATDVYSLGVILYELLTGKRPFRGDNVLQRVLTEAPPSPAWAAAVPRDLETICLKCLRKEPDQRYASAADLADDLRRFLDGRPIKGQRPGLWHCARQQVKQHPRRAAAALVLLALFVGALGAWAYIDATRRGPAVAHEAEQEHYEYFSAFTKRDGIPVGIHPLRASDLAKRPVTYRFVRNKPGGRLERVDVVNAQGNLAWNHDIELWIPGARANLRRASRECRFLLEYDKEGRLSKEIGVDPVGRKVWEAQYAYLEQPLPDGRREIILRALDPQTGNFVEDSAGVGAVRLIRNSEGLDEEAWFLDEDLARPMRSAVTGTLGQLQGVYGARLDYQNGLVVRVRFFDDRDQPMANTFGVFQVRMGYDQDENRVEEAHFDGRDGKLVNRDGVHRIAVEYDAVGAPRKMTSFDAEGNRVGDGQGLMQTAAVLEFHPARDGARERVDRFNPRGTRISSLETALGEDGNPIAATEIVFDREGEQALKLVRTFDKLGNTIREEQSSNFMFAATESSYDPATNYRVQAVTRDKAGAQVDRTVWEYEGGRVSKAFGHGPGDQLQWMIAYHYDELGRVSRETQYAADEETVVRESTYVYDSTSRLTTSRTDHLPEDDATTVTKWTYNDRGDIVAEWYEEKQGMPLAIGDTDDDVPQEADNGFAKLERTYDGFGRLIKETRSGYAQQERGYARYVEYYSQARYVSRQEFFDKQDQPARVGQGYSSVDHELDEFGGMVCSRYHGFDGSQGFETQVGTYGRNSNSFTYLDAEGRPARYNGAYLKYTAFTDPQSRRVVRRLYEDYPPEYGYFALEELTDEQGRSVTERYLDAQGKLVNNVQGVARVERSYGENKRIDAAYDHEGKPAHSRTWGHSRQEFVYEGDRLARERWSGYPAGTPWESRTLHFDDHGRVVGIDYRDSDAKLVLSDRGYARYAATHHDEQPPQGRWFDAEDKPLEGGVRVKAVYVVPHGAADRAGVRAGDVLLSYIGQPITSWAQLPYYTSLTTGSADKVTLDIERDGKRITLVEVDPGQLGIYPDDFVTAPHP